MAFVPNPKNLPEVNHIDGVKANCLPSNLEWSTRQKNMQHAVDNNLRKYKKGGVSKRLKLSSEQILDIYNSKEGSSVLASRHNLTKSSVQRIRSGKTYSAVTIQGKPLKEAYQKLTQDVADEIRSSSLSQRQLCEKYNISKGLVYNIKNNITYNGLV